MAFDVFTMPNGLRVVGEKVPYARSVAIGLYVGVGSQYEPARLSGISHFIEHMVFKGTQNRSAKQIAVEMDRIGGQINAYTSKECTCFYTKTLPVHLEEAMDVVFDLALHPLFDPDETEKEKGVVLEEIAMSEDDPEDLAHEMLMKAHFGNSAIARPILGTEKKVGSFTHRELGDFHAAAYHPCNSVFSIAGNYDPAQLREMLIRCTSEWNADKKAPKIARTYDPVFSETGKNRQTEQMHMCLGFPGVSVADPRNYMLAVICAAYGGAMSSRLFQHIREDLGLAYSVYSEPADYSDCGLLTVYAAVNPDSVTRVYDEILKLTKDFVKNGMNMREFLTAKEQLTCEVILGSESMSSRMQSNGRRMLLMNSVKTEEDVLRQLDSVQFDETNAYLAELLTSPHSISLVGRKARDIVKQLRTCERR